jgi:peptidoglycan/xylan/chitin deacetylase (PgdA/CDA1 family)
VNEEFYVDALDLVPPPTKPTVVFTFDDGRASVFDHAVPVLNQYDYPASTAVIPGRETHEDFLSINQLGTLQSRDWDVMSHPQRAESLRDYDESKQASVIESSKQWLLDRGFDGGSRFVVYPYSRWNRSTLEIAAEHHELAFGGGGVSTWVPPMPMLVPRIKGDDPERVRSAVDRVATYGGVLVLMYHAIDEDWIEPAPFRSIVSHVHDTAGLQVRSVGQWHDEIAGSLS